MSRRRIILGWLLAALAGTWRQGAAGALEGPEELSTLFDGASAGRGEAAAPVCRESAHCRVMSHAEIWQSLSRRDGAAALEPASPQPASQPGNGIWGPERDLTWPIVWRAGANTILGIRYAMTREPHGLGTTSHLRQFLMNFSRLPRWETNYSPLNNLFNYVLHPLAGSQDYLAARQQGFGPLTALGFAAAGSAHWEVVEAMVEPLSLTDLVVTPLGGMLLGELRYQALSGLRADPDPNALETALIILLDPIGSLAQLVLPAQ